MCPTVASELYPPGLTDVPGEVLRLGVAYRWRVVAMLGSLFLVLILYLAFFAAAGFLAYLLVVLPVPHLSGRALLGYLFFKFGGAFAVLLIWLFLLKGLFKKRMVEKSSYIELKAKDHAELFSFIRQLCQDTGAPRPRRVYASPEVNAALVYNTSLLNLVIPPRKDLLVGLGLVNVVNLVEFKAVLAHEFGHFAQRSVKLGSYVYVANRVMHDLVYSRDSLDDFVDAWSRQDVRIAFPAWGLKGMLWVIRKVLASIFEALNVLHLSLGRQMEFNADNVAVSVTGSDAIVHALSRLDFASECLADASQGLDAAADQGLFTDDLFYHQIRSADRLRHLRGADRLGLPPALPEDPKAQVQVFQPEEDGIPDRYRTHPTLYMREKNAKRFYVRSPHDDRPAWLLFGAVARLRREVTGRFYQHVLDRREAYTPRPAAEVQQWLDAEHAEMNFDPEYQGLYDGRLINPGDMGDLPDQVSATPTLGVLAAYPDGKGEPPMAAWPAQDITTALRPWSGEAFKKRMEAFHERQGEYQLLSNLTSGEWKLKGSTFPFRGKERTAQEIKGLFEQVDKELDADIEAFQRLDRQIFLAHLSLARLADGTARSGSGHAARTPNVGMYAGVLAETGDNPGPRCRELLERYRFHMAVQGLLLGLRAEQGRLQSVFQYITARQRLEENEFRQVQKALQEACNTLTINLEDAKKWKAPALTNVAAGTSLYSIIVDRGDPLPSTRLGDSISGEWLARLAANVEGVLKRVNRLQFKSLGALLGFQQKLRVDWQPVSASTPAYMPTLGVLAACPEGKGEPPVADAVPAPPEPAKAAATSTDP